MKAIEVLSTFKSIPEQSLFHESYVLEAMEAYANLKIEQLRTNFLEQLASKNKEISDLENEINNLKDERNVYMYLETTTKKNFEFLLKKVAEEAWFECRLRNDEGEKTDSVGFEKWYGTRTLTVG